MREAPHKTRELVSDKMREDPPTSIPYTNDDFTPIKSSPLSSQFRPSIDPSSFQDDIAISATAEVSSSSHHS